MPNILFLNISTKEWLLNWDKDTKKPVSHETGSFLNN